MKLLKKSYRYTVGLQGLIWSSDLGFVNGHNYKDPFK